MKELKNRHGLIAFNAIFKSRIPFKLLYTKHMTVCSSCASSEQVSTDTIYPV